ncbi:ABC transporter permease subunit [Azospirillum canadense]|uniref:ABC transporter permease subunit n=1 Tax=Azospirillum canadense TaxID=403962 RepID=UPI0022262E2B|nr:ABC transporter permease subunit [Azospirillum canadense]MCW2238861.1 His/Glu/Gln/Arg/opine family amino acid ABC transporter permease subunit [Azospirillum canadense]
MGLLAYGADGYGDELLAGAWVTVQLAVFAYALAAVLGTLMAILTLKPRGVRWAVGRVYASVATGVPSLLVIFLLYYGGTEIVHALLVPFGVDERPSISPFWAAVAALAFVYTPYLADLLRGAIHNVPKGQLEAAEALSVPRRQIWLGVLLPQALRIAYPGFVNIWVVLLKDTALVSLAGLTDLIAAAKVASGSTREPFLFYGVVVVFFVLFAAATIRLANRHARRLDRGVRPSEA